MHDRRRDRHRGPMPAAVGRRLDLGRQQTRIKRLGAGLGEGQALQEVALGEQRGDEQHEPGHQGVEEDREDQEPAPGTQMGPVKEVQRVLEQDARPRDLIQGRIADAVAEQPAPGPGDEAGQVVNEGRAQVQGRAPAEGQIGEPFHGDGGQDHPQVEGDTEDLGRNQHRQEGYRAVQGILGAQASGLGRGAVADVLAARPGLVAHQPVAHARHQRADQAADQAQVLDGASDRARAPHQPGPGRPGDNQELNEHQEEQIPGDVDRTLTVVIEERCRRRGPEQEAQHGQTDPRDPQCLCEGLPGEDEALLRGLRRPPNRQPAPQGKAAVVSRVRGQRGERRRDPLQVEPAVALGQGAAGRGTLVQGRLIGAEIVLKVDEVRDRPAVGFRLGGVVGGGGVADGHGRACVARRFEC